MPWTPETLPIVNSEADRRLLHELEPTVRSLLDEHTRTEQRWYPHVFEQEVHAAGRGIVPGQPWSPDMTPVSPAVISSLIVGEGTEKNLPKYVLQLENTMGGNSAMEDWIGRWSAEEDRHGDLIGRFLNVTYLVDPWHMEDVRMHNMSHGSVPQPVSAMDAVAYVTLQELATKESHNNTGLIVKKELGQLRDKLGTEGVDLPELPVYEDETLSQMSPTEKEVNRLLIIGLAGRKIMRRVASDETKHFVFYRELMKKALEIDPSSAVLAIERQIREFAMPGTDIPGFSAHAANIALTGIYDRDVHHRRVVLPILNYWKLESAEGLNEAAKQARESLVAHVERAGVKAAKFVERREKRAVASTNLDAEVA